MVNKICIFMQVAGDELFLTTGFYWTLEQKILIQCAVVSHCDLTYLL